VSDDEWVSRGDQHGGVDFAGVGAFFFPVQILAPMATFEPLARLGGIDAEIGWADDDFRAVVRLNQGRKSRKKSRVWSGVLYSSSWRRSVFLAI